jgi:hypothetical protein
MQTFHGSHTTVTEITGRGAYGGVFGATDAGPALSHGDVLHIVESPKPLTDFELNYTIQGAWDVALKICRGDEERAEAIMDAGCPCDSPDPEDHIEIQRLRGELARQLGYTSVEMQDEHGTTWLCLPGCSIRPA